MTPTLLLFDIDGTLITTGGAGYRAMKRAVAHTFDDQRSLDGIPNPQAYVFSAASSVYIDHVRRQKTRGDGFYEQVEEIELPSEAPGAVRVLEGKQRLERLKVILEELPERTREILLLSRLEGLSNTQLAARFGLSVSAIEKNLMRALVHIRSRSVADE